MSLKKCCENCSFWKRWEDMPGTAYGDCTFQIPHPRPAYIDGMESMRTNDGKNCETYQEVTQ